MTITSIISLLCSAESAEMYGLKLKVGTVVIACAKDKTNPKFAQVQDIYVTDNKVYLGTTVLEILEYSTHFHAWIVQRQENKLIIDVKDLSSKQILTLRQVRGTFGTQHFITMKYAL